MIKFKNAQFFRAVQQHIKKHAPDYNEMANVLRVEPSGRLVYTDGFVILIMDNGAERVQELEDELQFPLHIKLTGQPVIPKRAVEIEWDDGVLTAKDSRGNAKLLNAPEGMQGGYPDYERVIPADDWEPHKDAQSRVNALLVYHALNELVTGEVAGTWRYLSSTIAEHIGLSKRGIRFLAALQKEED